MELDTIKKEFVTTGQCKEIVGVDPNLYVPQLLQYGRLMNKVVFDPDGLVSRWAFEGLLRRNGLIPFKRAGPYMGITAASFEEAHRCMVHAGMLFSAPPGTVRDLSLFRSTLLRTYSSGGLPMTQLGYAKAVAAELKRLFEIEVEIALCVVCGGVASHQCCETNSLVCRAHSQPVFSGKPFTLPTDRLLANRPYAAV